jgi:hypothetical protein
MANGQSGCSKVLEVARMPALDRHRRVDGGDALLVG